MNNNISINGVSAASGADST